MMTGMVAKMNASVLSLPNTLPGMAQPPMPTMMAGNSTVPKTLLNGMSSFCAGFFTSAWRKCFMPK